MKTKLVTTVTFIIIGMGMLIMSSGFKPSYQNKPWPVPDNYKTMKNPVASDEQ